jgi:hypothetical protein
MMDALTGRECEQAVGVQDGVESVNNWNPYIDHGTHADQSSYCRGPLEQIGSQKSRRSKLVLSRTSWTNWITEVTPIKAPAVADLLNKLDNESHADQSSCCRGPLEQIGPRKSRRSKLLLSRTSWTNWITEVTPIKAPAVADLLHKLDHGSHADQSSCCRGPLEQTG